MELKQEDEKWRAVFNECYDRLSDQRLPLLKENVYDYIISNEPAKTPFYKMHEKELAAAEVFRRCFQGYMCSYYKQVTGHETLVADLIISESSKMMESLAESWIPGLRMSALISISGEVYESAHTSGQTMVVLSEEEITRCSAITVFHENNHLPLTSNNGHAIRKQLNTCGEKSALVIAWEGDGYKTQGLAPLSMQQYYPSICFIKHLHWELYLPAAKLDMGNTNTSKIGCDGKLETRCIVRFCRGSIRFPLWNIKEEYQEITTSLFQDNDDAKRIATLLSRINMKKGTSLVISTPEVIAAEGKRLARDNHRGIPFRENKLHSLIDGNGVKKDMLRQFSSIDGALLVDSHCFCHAFGVILDGLAVEGDSNRGARFNSMLSYQNKFQTDYPNTPLLCAVFSEDGMIDVLTSKLSAEEKKEAWIGANM